MSEISSITAMETLASKMDDAAPIEVSGDEAQAFEELMAQEDSASGAAQGLGDSMISGLQKVKASIDVRVDSINKAASNDAPLSTQELLGVQLDLTKLTLQSDVLNKTVTQLNRGLDTLFKPQ